MINLYKAANNVFNLQQFQSLYRLNSKFLDGNKVVIVESVSPSTNTTFIRDTKGGGLQSVKSDLLKIVLRPVEAMEQQQIQVVCSLALNRNIAEDKFTFTRREHKILAKVSTGESVAIAENGDVAVLDDHDTYLTINMGLITAYMINESIDMFGLIKAGHAITANV